MEMREAGSYRLEELISDTDSSLAYRYADTSVRSMASGSWEMANAEVDHSIEWIAVDDCDHDDESDVGMSLEAYARLVTRARTCCPACPGDCGRA